ncbi:MAG: hypothetical protein OEY85_12145 [Rhodospirillales bacterium]|nr:hypothetical protein [Rhodospirillales bacterium]
MGGDHKRLAPGSPRYDAEYAFGYWGVMAFVFVLGVVGWFLTYDDSTDLKWGGRVFFCFIPIGFVALMTDLHGIGPLVG